MYTFWFDYLDKPWQDLSFYKITKNYILSLISPLITIFSGFKLLLRKKIGWALSSVILLYQSINWILSPWSTEIELTENKLQVSLFVSLISLTFFTLCVLLLWKPIRTKYSPTKKTYVIMFSLFSILVLKKVLFD
jgi:hypothetical protein